MGGRERLYRGGSGVYTGAGGLGAPGQACLLCSIQGTGLVAAGEAVLGDE